MKGFKGVFSNDRDVDEEPVAIKKWPGKKALAGWTELGGDNCIRQSDNEYMTAIYYREDQAAKPLSMAARLIFDRHVHGDIMVVFGDAEFVASKPGVPLPRHEPEPGTAKDHALRNDMALFASLFGALADA